MIYLTSVLFAGFGNKGTHHLSCYRPILTAVKTFAADENPIDIEELCKLKCLNSPKDFETYSKSLEITQKDIKWSSPSNLDQLLDLIAENKSIKYRFLGGNTGSGVFKNDGPYSLYIDFKNIPELFKIERKSEELVIGSGVSLSKMIEIFSQHQKFQDFEYLSIISNHLSKIANIAVRNSATWAGNLMLKHQHPDFPSDIFISFLTTDPILTIIDSDRKKFNSNLNDFLTLDMNGKIIYSISFKKLEKSKNFIRTYKIMPRHRNAHAYVNAGFRFEIDPQTSLIQNNPRIIFGGISSKFIHASKTEEFLSGKSIKDFQVLKESFKILFEEIEPDQNPVYSSTGYRKSLSVSLFYKFLLEIKEKNLSLKLKSAYESIMDQRHVSTGQQKYPTNPDLFPITKNIPKLNAYSQASGEASYAYDLKPLAGQLYGAFIQSSLANCRIESIDSSEAAKAPGVVRILFSQDIPGQNNFVPKTFFSLIPEKLFCDDYIDYAGQSLGLVVAETHEQAVQAAKMVKITYKDIKKPILTISEAIETSNFHPKPCPDFVLGNFDEELEKSAFKVQGEFSMEGQYHFFMENHVSICSKNDEGYEIYSGTQWTEYVQSGVAQVLGIQDCSSINVKVKQLGGSFGGKVTRANLPATAAALACKILHRPVRVALNLDDCISLVGKRPPWLSRYKVGFNEKGKILALQVEYYADRGCTPNDALMSEGVENADNVYNIKNWRIVCNLVKTNLPANTTMRSVETVPTIGTIEYIMEHVAKELKMSPLQVRQENMYTKEDMTIHNRPLNYFNVDRIIEDLRQSSEYDRRLNEVEKFNSENRWKKRGISIVPIKWAVASLNAFFTATVSIYAFDGSVSVEHGGVEMGQGINTKVAQMVAYALKIPIEKISIKFTDSRTNPNGRPTGGSVASELCCQAALECCSILNDRLKPLKEALGENYIWQDLITKAYYSGIDLSARFRFGNPSTKYSNFYSYDVYGAAVSEVLIDVLTGETQIKRVDILYDAGESHNTFIDIGQAEGAFVQGVGLWVFEKPKYDPESGRCLTAGTWEYKPPMAQDIPEDFRVTLLDNNPNPIGVLGSRTISEAPLNLSTSVFLAIKKAIESAREEIGNDSYFQMNSPSTFDSVQQLCLVDYNQFSF